MQHERLTCRLCGGLVKPVFALSPTPIANTLRAHPDTEAVRYRLELAQCRACWHVQIRDVVPDAELYSDYRYATPGATRPAQEQRARRLAKEHPRAKCVLEIGSNNGILLHALRKEGFTALGVDPAGDHGTSMRVAFTSALAEKLCKFDLVIANNVFAHIDDLDDVFKGIALALADDGALVFEVQYLPAMVKAGAFDMIYHEHRDYHAVAPLKPFLARHGLRMTKIDMIADHGGSLRVTARRDGVEAEWNDDSHVNWSAFAVRVNNAKAALLDQMNGKRVIALGATAKACTLIHHFGIQDRIEYCVDSTPAKHGRYIAGTNIKIHPVETLYQSKSVKSILLTAWNHAAIIKQQHPDFDYIEPFKEIA